MDVASLGRGYAPASEKVQAPEAATSSSSTSQTASQTSGKVVQTPIIAFDSSTGDPVLQFRDPQSGDQTFQVPSKQALEYAQLERLAKESAPPTKSVTV